MSCAYYKVLFKFNWGSAQQKQEQRETKLWGELNLCCKPREPARILLLCVLQGVLFTGTALKDKV